MVGKILHLQSSRLDWDYWNSVVRDIKAQTNLIDMICSAKERIHRDATNMEVLIILVQRNQLYMVMTPAHPIQVFETLRSLLHNFKSQIFYQKSKRYLPLRKVISNLAAMVTVTAGLRCPPLKSPSVQAMVVTMKPIPIPTWTGPPNPFPHSVGKAACTDIRKKVPKNSAVTSRQKRRETGSALSFSMYEESFMVNDLSRVTVVYLEIYNGNNQKHTARFGIRVVK